MPAQPLDQIMAPDWAAALTPVEPGLRLQVPLFINAGDRIKLDTRTGKYVSRV